MKCNLCDGEGIIRSCFDKNISAECPRCNGTGEIKEPKKTNFQRITTSPEALAEFITDIIYDCDDMNSDEDGKCCYVCPMNWCSKDKVVAWLKQESE